MISRTYLDGCRPKMAYVPLKIFTGTSTPKTPSNFLNRVQGVFFPRQTRSFGVDGTANLQPIIRAFTWRLISRALATSERAARFSTHIDEHCSACGALEDDAHLFFHFDLPRAVWFTFTPSMRTDNLPQENNGIQLILQSFISNSTSDALFQKILFTLWYIWKARNDNRFQRKTWTPVQVHNAVAAHINTHTHAMFLQLNVAADHTSDTPQPLNRERRSQQGMPSPNTGMPTRNASSSEHADTPPTPTQTLPQPSSPRPGIRHSPPQV